MNTTTVSKNAPKTPAKSNGSPSPTEDHAGEQPAATTTAAPSVPTTTATDKKPVTVMLTERLHKRVKTTAELSGVSLSDLVEEQLPAVVKARLPGLLTKLDTGD